MKNTQSIPGAFFASRYLVPIFLVAVVSGGCANQGESRMDISGQGLLDKMKTGWEPAILDVRTGMEYRGGHVPGAQNISFWTPLFGSDDIQINPEKPVVVYCEHGPRAYIAAYGLRQSGYEQIYYLRGHMSQWRKDGLPIEKPESEE